MAKKQLDVEYLFTMTLEIGDITNAAIRNGPVGTRYVAAVAGGHFDGPRIKGTVVPPGGDWLYSPKGGSSRLDVRVLLVTDDGTSILMSYQGIGTRTDDGLTLRTAPLFEAPEGDHGWLNDVQAVGLGRSDGTSVTYEIYALT